MSAALAWVLLLVVDLAIAAGGFPCIHRIVRRVPVWHRRSTLDTVAIVTRVNRGVARAAVWYPRPLHCLPRSAAAAWLLRWHGLPAVLVVGIRPMPFYAHAWVELEGRVVNDAEDVVVRYPAIDRVEPRRR
jgi:hypothetical protein